MPEMNEDELFALDDLLRTASESHRETQEYLEKRALRDAAGQRPSYTPEELAAAQEKRDEQRAANEARERELAVGKTLAEVFRGRERYRSCTFENYEVYDPRQGEALAATRNCAEQITTKVAPDRSALVYGPPGTGKDHLVAAMVTAAANAGYSVVWRNGLDLYGDIRDRMDSKLETESSFIGQLVAPAVLVISDPLPPIGDLTPYQQIMLYRIVEGRYARGKPTWTTLNVSSSEEAYRRVGAPTMDRLRHDALLVPCNWQSYRARKRGQS